MANKGRSGRPLPGGRSYQKRLDEVNRIYSAHSRDGLSNREIWQRYIYPVYAISERTFYNLLSASVETEDKRS